MPPQIYYTYLKNTAACDTPLLQQYQLKRFHEIQPLEDNSLIETYRYT